MNIAVSSIVLFLVLAPGYLYKLAYRTSRFSIKSRGFNLLDDLVLSIIPSIVFQSLFYMIMVCCTDYRIDFEVLSTLLLGSSENKVSINAFLNLEKYFFQIVSYNILLLIFSYSLGHFSRWIIREANYDRKYRPLRFSNKWYYILSGECLDFDNVPDKYENISYKIIDLLCKVDGRSIIYIGELFDYYIKNDGELEAIHLRYPFRRFLSDDNKEDDGSKYYQIPSKYLIIPREEILNINVRYIYVNDKSEIENSDENLNEINIDE